MFHDPSEYIRQIQQLLVSDKKKIAFLFGAGTSTAPKNSYSKMIPAIRELTNDIKKILVKTPKYNIAIEEIEKEIGVDFTIENLLSNIEQKRQIIGKGTLNGLVKTDFDDLVCIIKKNIRKEMSIHKTIKIEDTIHIDFAEWIGRADRKYPIEIFTTNYDYLFEIALEQKKIPYYDGFTGSYNPFFNSESIEDLNFLPNQTKLWKIHGSLGWHYDEQTKQIWRKDSDANDILIYPSTLKYNDSKKQPFTSLGDRLSNFLKQADSILIICGYSFGDEHINERLTTALSSNVSSHIYVLYYDKIKKDGSTIDYLLTENSYLAKLAKENSKFSVWGSRNAVIGCQYGTWRLKREPDKNDVINIDLYFDSDGPTDKSDPIGSEMIGQGKWTGEGNLKITDFKYFVEFLKSMMISTDTDKITI